MSNLAIPFIERPIDPRPATSTDRIHATIQRTIASGLFRSARLEAVQERILRDTGRWIDSGLIIAAARTMPAVSLRAGLAPLRLELVPIATH